MVKNSKPSIPNRCRVSRSAAIALSVLSTTTWGSTAFASEFGAVISLAALDGRTGFRLDGEAAGDQLGASIASIGDVNGDGFDDIIVGAPDAQPNGSHSGSSYVVFGWTTGFPPKLDLSALDG